MRALLLAALFILPLAAAPSPTPAAAQTERILVDDAVVDRAIAYLNSVRTMTARFVHRDHRGGRWSGRLWMERPGRLRIDYDPPSNDVIWSSGGFVKHYDAALQTVTHVPRHLTPAWFLLDADVQLTDDVKVLATAEVGERYYVTAASSDDLAFGRVTLAFRRGGDGAHERITGWTVTAADGAITQIDLTDLVVGGPVESGMFQYLPPIPENPD